jgi:hypothetical protein
LIASRTATVRDGSAPAAAVRNADPGTAVPPAELADGELADGELADGVASGVIIMYGISYMTWVEGKPDRREVSNGAPGAGPPGAPAVRIMGPGPGSRS